MSSILAPIVAALRDNPKCSTGLMCPKQAFEMDCGPSGGPEVLVLIYADVQHHGYWYGHIRRKPGHSEDFSILLVWSRVFVNAPTVPLLFARFDYWMRVRLEYHPCAAQKDGDAYAEARSLDEATSRLAVMIRAFDLDLRYPDEDSPHYEDPPDLRILSVFPIPEHEEREWIGPPMPQPLRSV